MAACAPYFVEPAKGGIDPFLKAGALRGWRYILVDQWGPYDFKSPVLWPRGNPSQGSQVYEILGPAGSAKVVEQVGCAVDGYSVDNARTWRRVDGALPVPCFVKVAYGNQKGIERKLTLEYKGAAVTDYRGVVTPAGMPFRFGYRAFFVPIDWTVKFYKWDEATDPRTKPEAFQTLIGGNPVKIEKVDRINYAGGVPGVPGNYFATVGDGTFEIPPGDYVLNLTTDDGARLWYDGELVVKDAWKYQGPTLYTVDIKVTPGKHRVRVEHFQIDGYSALKVEIARKRP